MPGGDIIAVVDKVDIVGTTPAAADTLTKGLDFLKSRVTGLSGGQHAEYTITVQHEGRRYTVRKRFSDFATLHGFLKERFGERLSFDLPSKTAVRYFSPEALEDRKNALNAYMKELGRRGDITATPQVQTFFGIGQGAGYTGGDYVPGAQNNAAGSAAAGGYAPAADSAPKAAPKRKPRTNSDSDDDLIGWDK